MRSPNLQPTAMFAAYTERLNLALRHADWSKVTLLAQELLACWREGRQVFLIGNGGSAGNAMHLANDFLYGIAKDTGPGLRVHALPANGAVMTCLANDVGYDSVFALQLATQARKGDVLIALSGSGNSGNIVKALEQARTMGMKSFAILGFSGGKAKGLADVPIHFVVNDMQVAEDTQMIVGHMVMQWLYANRAAVAETKVAETKVAETKVAETKVAESR
jgi:D-sedoheptulose 7-phosphate isomerase